MSDDWKTLRVPPGAYEQAKEQKEANGRTWGEQIVREENGDPNGSTIPMGDADETAAQALERIKSSVETVEQRTGSIERALEDLQR